MERANSSQRRTDGEAWFLCTTRCHKSNVFISFGCASENTRQKSSKTRSSIQHVYSNWRATKMSFHTVSPHHLLSSSDTCCRQSLANHWIVHQRSNNGFDIKHARAAAEMFIGLHDFRSLMSVSREHRTVSPKQLNVSCLLTALYRSFIHYLHFEKCEVSRFDLDELLPHPIITSKP